MGKFKTPAEIDAHFQPQLDEATDDAARFAVMGQREQAKSTFYEERDRERELVSARAAATQQFPMAKPELISGNTPDEVMASAKAQHDYVTEQRQAAIDAEKEALTQQARQRAYGGGGGQPPPPAPPGQGGNRGSSPAMELVDRVQETLRRGSGVLLEQDSDEFAATVGHALFRQQIDGKLPEDWEGTVHVRGNS